MHYQKLYPHKTVIAQEKMDEWNFLNPHKTVIAQAQFQEKMDECELVRKKISCIIRNCIHTKLLLHKRKWTNGTS